MTSSGGDAPVSHARHGASRDRAASGGPRHHDVAPPALAPLPHAPGVAALLAYGAPAAPLAFVALPLYVQWPAHHAATQGVALATLGAMLLAVRLLDAAVDPWIGRQADHWLRDGTSDSHSATRHEPDAHRTGRPGASVTWHGVGSSRRAWRIGAMAISAVAVGFVALFFPPSGLGATADLVWATVALALTSIAYSAAQVLHQAWGARLGGPAAAQARIVGAREGQALVGVLVASALPALAGFGWTAAALALWLLAGWWALGRGPAPCQPPAPADARPDRAAEGASLGAPLHHPAFRRLLLLHAINGLASAVPATLVLFFIRDRLQQPAAEAPLLALYFLCAALAVPLWVRLVARHGLIATWAAGMALSIAAFAWATALGPGDAWTFALVCAASGAALGADLTVPPALVAGLVRRNAGGPARQGGPIFPLREGACFGWWNLVAKVSLALAAGLALPLVQVLGYEPGARDGAGLTALALVYAGLPCVLKALALALLWSSRAHWPEMPDASPAAASAEPLAPGAAPSATSPANP